MSPATDVVRRGRSPLQGNAAFFCMFVRLRFLFALGLCSLFTGVRGKVGSRRQSIVHEELTAIGVGNDLNLIGWKMTIFEAFRRGATMDHEPWLNCLFPIDRASASQRVSKVRSSLSWRLLLEELLLLGSASRHGFRTINLQGKSPRYRSLPTLHAEQAVSHGLPR